MNTQIAILPQLYPTHTAWFNRGKWIVTQWVKKESVGVYFSSKNLPLGTTTTIVPVTVGFLFLFFMEHCCDLVIYYYLLLGFALWKAPEGRSGMSDVSPPVLNIGVVISFHCLLSCSSAESFNSLWLTFFFFFCLLALSPDFSFLQKIL